ncbi:MAG: hypothetical protein CMN78_06515 [Spirochaetales bacterium]|nr:hypothetical protein [Spirochaetales bacterium]
MPKKKLSLRQIVFAVSGVLLALSLLFPYLGIIFTSPQYPDRSPKMFLYAYGLKGDFKDWEILGRYIGINIYPELPEFDSLILVIIIAILAALTIASAFLAMKWKKILPILLAVAALCFAGWAQYRLYQQGHSLDPTAPLRFTVKPFTPPLIGITKVSRIRIYHFPHVGIALYTLAIIGTAFARWRREKGSPKRKSLSAPRGAPSVPSNK